MGVSLGVAGRPTAGVVVAFASGEPLAVEDSVVGTEDEEESESDDAIMVEVVDVSDCAVLLLPPGIPLGEAVSSATSLVALDGRLVPSEEELEVESGDGELVVCVLVSAVRVVEAGAVVVLETVEAS